MRGQIFISYRRATDAWAVDKLRDELVGAFGEKNIFLDQDTIASGDDWEQRIDDSVRGAAAVVVVFSAQWYGQPKEPAAGADAALVAPPDGAAPPGPAAATRRQRRIDDPNDKLRRELEMALKHGREIFPIIVDDSPEPRPDELPDSVRAVLKRQFLRIDVDGKKEEQMARLIGDIRHATAGKDWLVRLSGQAAWLGLLALSLVLAAHQVGWGGLEIFRNGFARGAMALRDRMALAAPSVAVVEMGEPEYRELFGGRAPLDPQLMGILLTRLTLATSRCDQRLPVVLNLDLAPNAEDNEAGDQARMTQALLKLAACRPVVLACPPNVRRGSPAWYEMRWMNELRAKAEANPRIHLAFGTAMADPEGLRRARGRSEIGVLAADMAAGRPAFQGHDRPQCVCPATPRLAAACADQPMESDWDDRGFAVPLPGSSDRRLTPDPTVAAAPTRTLRAGAGLPVLADPAPQAEPGGRPAHLFNLHEAVARAEDLMRFDAVLFGSNRSQMRHAVPGRPRKAFEGVSSIVTQAHLLNGAVHHEPQRGRSGMLLLGLLAGWLVAAMVLLAGRELERNDQRYAHRGNAYLLFVVGLLAVPGAALLAGAQWPESIWWLALLAGVAMLASGRALMSCFEIVLNRGLAWRWPSELHREYLHGNAKSSALLRMATFGAEAGLIIACWVVIALQL
jgi:hypothetical protein